MRGRAVDQAASPLLVALAYIWCSKHCQRSAASWQSAAPRTQCQHRSMRRKGEDAFTMKRRRLPYAAKIK